MKLFMGLNGPNHLGKFSQIWKSLAGIFLPDGEVAALVVVKDDPSAAQAHDRYITAVAETEPLMGHMTWTEEENVTAIRFKLTPNAAGAQAIGDIVRVVFDATPVDDIADTGQAFTYLTTAVDDPAIDVEYNELTYIPKASLDDADGHWSRWFEFSLPLRRADFHYVDGNGATTDVNILAEVG